MTMLALVLAVPLIATLHLMGLMPFWRRLTPEMPFARLDLRYYSPLCLALGAGLVVLALKGFAA